MRIRGGLARPEDEGKADILEDGGLFSVGLPDRVAAAYEGLQDAR